MLRKSGRIAARLLPLLLAVCLITGLLGVMGCNNDDGDVLLTLIKGDQTQTYTLTQLKSMTAVAGKASFMRSTGEIQGEATFKGVELSTLAGDVGGLGAGEAAKITASDEYAMTMTYDRIVADAFTTFDASGAEVDGSDRDLKVIVAYEKDDAAIDTSDGPLRLLIVAADGNLVSTEGHWWVKHVVKIEINEAEVSWTLSLKGGANGMDEEMTNNTFEAGAAPGCHGVTYTDADGDEWTGIPLWRLIGRVDDSDAHGKTTAFNETKAATGYQVKIIHYADSAITEFTDEDYIKTVDITDVPQSDDPETTWIVAYELNGESLPQLNDKKTKAYGPLKLVGNGLSSGTKVGGIDEIQLVNLPA